MKLRNVTFAALIGVAVVLAGCGCRQSPPGQPQPAQKKASEAAGGLKAAPKPAAPASSTPAAKSKTPAEQPAGASSQDKMEVLKQKTGEAVSAAKDVYEEKKAIIQKQLDEQYKALQTRLDQVKKDLAATSRRVEKKTHEGLDLAEEKRAEAAQKLDDLKTGTEDTWETLKKDTRAALADLQKIIDDLTPKKAAPGSSEGSTATVPPKDSKAADRK